MCKLLYRPIFVGPFGARWAPSGPSGPPAFAGAAADKLRHCMTNVKWQRLGIMPPWLVALPEVDRSLTLEVSKNEAPNILAALSRDKIDQKYSQYVQIYTDASKDPSGKVVIGCYIRSFASSPDIEMEARLTDAVAAKLERWSPSRWHWRMFVNWSRLRHTDDTQSSQIR